MGDDLDDSLSDLIGDDVEGAKMPYSEAVKEPESDVDRMTREFHEEAEAQKGKKHPLFRNLIG